MFKKMVACIAIFAILFALSACGSRTSIDVAASDEGLEGENRGQLIEDGQVPLAETAGSDGFDEQTSTMAKEIFALCNEVREENHLEPFVWSNALYAAADVRAEELLQTFSHTRPDQTKWTTALADANISYSSAAENVAIGYRDAKAVVNGWMNSEGHRKNLLSANTHFAVAAVACPTGLEYKGYAFAQLFYKP